MPAFRHSTAASTVTFGRASYTITITPSGTRSLAGREAVSQRQLAHAGADRVGQRGHGANSLARALGARLVQRQPVEESAAAGRRPHPGRPVGLDDAVRMPPRSPRRRPPGAAFFASVARAASVRAATRARGVSVSSAITATTAQGYRGAPLRRRSRGPRSRRSSPAGVLGQADGERLAALLRQLHRVAGFESSLDRPSPPPAAGWCPGVRPPGGRRRPRRAGRAPACRSAATACTRAAAPGWREVACRRLAGRRCRGTRARPAAGCDHASGCRRRWPSPPPAPCCACRRSPMSCRCRRRSSPVEQRWSRTSAISSRAGDAGGRGRVDRRCRSAAPAAGRSQEQRHLGGQRVVVAESDLVGGCGVVLVHHRHHAPPQQRLQRTAGVDVGRRGGGRRPRSAAPGRCGSRGGEHRALPARCSRLWPTAEAACSSASASRPGGAAEHCPGPARWRPS